jgi:hypothetical protein
LENRKLVSFEEYSVLEWKSIGLDIGSESGNSLPVYMDPESRPRKPETKEKVMMRFSGNKNLSFRHLDSHLHLKASAIPCALSWNSLRSPILRNFQCV